MNDLVSIIMPSYNSEKYISVSVKSIISQSYVNWELIVVDDCSTDNTLEIVQSFEDDRIKILKNEHNSGAAVSRNRGLREARGKWVAFLDSDDVWHPDKLLLQLNFMKENGYSFSCTDYRIELNGEWLPYVNTGPMVVNKRKMYNYCYFSTITVIYDREKVGLVQIENLRKNNDYAMWLEIIEKCNCYRLPKCLSFYIKHDGSVSSGSKVKLIKWHYILFRKGLHKNPFVSVILTVNNLFFGVLKKITCKHAVSSEEERLTREAVSSNK